METDMDDLIDVGDIDLIPDILAGNDIDAEVTGGAPSSVIKKVDKKVYAGDKFTGVDGKLHVDDMRTILLAEVRRRGVAGNTIASLNSLYRIGIKQILTKIFHIDQPRMKNKRDKTEEDREIEYISFNVYFTDVSLMPPTTTKYKSGSQQMLTPGLARIRNLTYSAPMYISAKITAMAHLRNGKTLTRTEELKHHHAAGVPVATRTDLCNTAGLTHEGLKALEEDPLNPGGSFIVGGGEWNVDNLESVVINGLGIHRAVRVNERVRGEFISKPGDAYENSFYLLTRLMTTGALVVQIQATKFTKLDIPFYMIFRAFGMTRDKDIIDSIVYGTENDDPVTVQMLSILETAFNLPDPVFGEAIKSTNPDEILGIITEKLLPGVSASGAKKDDNAMKYVNNRAHAQLDKLILPHIGNDPALRVRKARFLGHLIHKILRVELRVLDPTDRDSLRNKRVHSAGVSLAKSFKTQVNFILIQAVKQHLIKDFVNTPFSKMALADSVKAAINTEDLERVLTQVITSGNRIITVKRNEVTNRVSSQSVYHKNDLNYKSILNTVNVLNMSAAKQTERSDEMRRVHPSMIGYIGVTQSADTGEKVGMNKQLACSASVVEASSSEAMKLTLYEDPDFIHIDAVPDPGDFSRRKLTKVFVNGDWIGYVEHGHKTAYYYRMARRYGDIHPFTTIVWEPLVRELYFWVDVGRLTRPLLIVYNNLEQFVAEYKSYREKGGRPYTAEDYPGRRVTPSEGATRGTVTIGGARPDGVKGKARADDITPGVAGVPPDPRPRFQQWIKLTKSHINGLRTGELTMEDLRKERILEYISPEEQENAYLSYSYDLLLENQHNYTMQFTHCDIELAIFGLVELSAPNTNHSPASRITMFTNQKKQTCGWFALNYPYRIDKNTFLQYYCDKPLVQVFSDAITYPNGENIILAYMMYTGQNQEDSSIVNQSSVDRGLFNGCFYRYEKSELEKGESFGPLDMPRTVDIKRDANYGLTEEGFIRENAIASKGDVLIVKSAKIQQPVDGYLYTDRSTVYKYPEPSFVEKVIVTRGAGGTQIGKVKLRSERRIRVGDKISSRAGNKSIVAALWPSADMPYAEDGLIPDILINPHGIPSRMVIGQIWETLMGDLAVEKGCFMEASAFKKIDIKAVMRELETKYGIKCGGHKRMYNGKTGNWFDTLIFIGPIGYQRLQKFVLDESYSVATGPTSALTRQPLDGKSNEGGLRIGEIKTSFLSLRVCAKTHASAIADDISHMRCARHSQIAGTPR